MGKKLTRENLNIWNSCKEMLPLINYKAFASRKLMRKKVFDHGDAPEVHSNVRYKFRITTFYTINCWQTWNQYDTRGEICSTKKRQRDFLPLVMSQYHIMWLNPVLSKVYCRLPRWCLRYFLQLGFTSLCYIHSAQSNVYNRMQSCWAL